MHCGAEIPAAGVPRGRAGRRSRRPAERTRSARPLSLRLLGLLSEAALEVSSQLPAGHVELRLAGQEPSLVYVADEAPTQPAPADDGLTARITLRLPDSLKSSLETAASQEGVSLNTWIVKALARGLSIAAATKIGSRLTGYGQS